MAECFAGETRAVKPGEPIKLTSYCRSAFAIGAGLIFNADGEYLVSVHGNHIVVRDYPRTAVPGHGRLIDADALASEMEKQIQKQDGVMELCKSAGDTKNYFNTYKVQSGMVSFLRALNDATTIIPADKEEA